MRTTWKFLAIAVLGVLALNLVVVLAPAAAPAVLSLELGLVGLTAGVMATSQEARKARWRVSRRERRGNLEPGPAVPWRAPRGHNPAIWGMSLLAFYGLAFAQGDAPNWSGLFNPIFVAAVWTAISAVITIPITQTLKVWLGTTGLATNWVNGAVNAGFVGFGTWIGGGYRYGLNGALFSVATALVGWGIDYGLVQYQRSLVDRQAQAIVAAQKDGG